MEKAKYIIQNPLSSSYGKVIGTLLFVLIAGGVLAATLRDSLSGSQQAIQENESTPQNPIATKALLYGQWKGDTSQIFAYDLATQKEYEVATLPINIKKVTLLNENELIFINETDERDHGQSIAVYSIDDKSYLTMYTADNGFGIDDYVLSPDKTKIAVWELQFTQENILRGGVSQVFTADISSPGIKNTIATENANIPVLYPVGITNSGEVYMDRFLPNAGTGWAFGMAVSDFTGSNVENIENMQSGTYGTQPQMSPDGNLFVFGGYDGSLGSGNDEARGYRRAILSTNTVEILDTQTRERSPLPFSNSNTYTGMQWEPSGEIRLSILSKNPDQTGTFLYNLDNQIREKVDTDLAEEASALIASVDNSVEIFGNMNTSADLLGNLGPKYASPYSDITIHSGGKKYTPSISTSLGQVLGIANSSQLNTQTLSATSVTSREQLKLGSLEIKPTLEEKRSKQQSEEILTPTPTLSPKEPLPTPQPTERPKCFEVAREQCNELIGTNYKKQESDNIKSRYTYQDRCARGVKPELYCKYFSKPLSEQEKAYMACFWKVDHEQKMQGLCTASPLYLYGPEGLEVDVQIHTPIFESNIPGNGSYTFTLAKDNRFTSEGKSYESLAFDYQAQRNARPPLYGSVVKKEKVESTVKEYAKKLGLNKKETYDLVKDIVGKVIEPYAFISFYDQSTSKYLLPITFDPQPDTYINYVFVIDNLTSPQDLGYTPKEPKFNITPRTGDFVAVELSVISD